MLLLLRVAPRWRPTRLLRLTMTRREAKSVVLEIQQTCFVTLEAVVATSRSSNSTLTLDQKIEDDSERRAGFDSSSVSIALFFFSRFSVCIGWPSVPSLIERTRCQASRVATTLRIAAARLLRSRQRSSRDSPFAWRRAPRRASAMQPLWRASASRQASANGRASYPKDLVRILQQ